MKRTERNKKWKIITNYLFSELAFEKGKWEIKQSVLEISNIEDFLSFSLFSQNIICVN